MIGPALTRLPLAAALILALAQGGQAGPEVTVDLSQTAQGVTSQGLNAAIDTARGVFDTDPDTVYTITLPPGRFQMPQTIDLSGIQPSDTGRLIIAGAGMDQTTIVQSPDTVGIEGRNLRHVTVQGMTFTLDIQTTTQGHVVSVDKGQVVLDIAPGFPSPLDLLDAPYRGTTGCKMIKSADGGWGRYLKTVTEGPNGPEMTDPTQDAVPYCIPEPVAGHEGRWLFPLRMGAKKDPTPDWAPGSLVAVKSKFMENAYFFCGGQDFAFKDIRWLQRSRGVWRCGFDGVHLDGVEVRRPPAIMGQVPALSSPGGGPQIGQPDEPSSGHLVENSTFEATGDDAVAFFDASGILRNCTMQDLFGRVFTENSQVTMTNNTLTRTRLVQR